MAITINVQGAPASGGGGNNQNPTPQPQQPTPTPQPSNPPSQQPQPTGGQNNSSNSIPFTVTQGAPTQPASPQPTQPTQQPNTGSQSNQSQPTTQTVTPAGQNPPANQPKPSQPIRYQRPDFNQFKSNGQSPIDQPLPTSERMVNDVRAEISRRGIILVPGTQNFSTMLNTLQQQQRGNIMGQIDSVHDARIQDIDKRDAALYTEIKARLDASRQSELDGVTDPLQASIINKRYDELEDREFKNAGKFFAGEYAQVESDRSAQKAEAEQRLTEALQRLTEELSQGNKDSYLGQLRDKYKTAVWERDNAATEEEVREASREAAKIQERMQRAMNPGASPTMQRWLGAAGTIATTAIHTGIRLDELGIQEDYLGLGMASSVLNGNATAAIRQRNAIERQENSTLATGIGAGAGAIAGAAIGSYFGGVGAIPGYLIGGLIGTLLGTGGGALVSHAMNRDLMIEDERTKVADLWKQEEQRIMGFNNLVMLYRGQSSNPDNIEGLRRTMVAFSGENKIPMSDGRNQRFKPLSPWTRSEDQLDLYDLGYTAPEFAEKFAQRIKQRGMVTKRGETFQQASQRALEADALERVYSLNSGALGQLSAFDRFGRNDANQDFTNLAFTLANLNTTGMQNGSWARSDEFAGYMTQLQGQQLSTFLTVDNERAARQIATGQGIFGDKFGPQAMRGIQQINDRIQNPAGGFAQTLLYDVIQELYPDTRGDLRKIEMAQYDPSKQDRIQKAYARRIASIYGSPETTSGFLAFQEIYGIENPNVLNPLAKQMLRGGLEAKALDKSHTASEQAAVLNNGYTPEVTQKYNALADQQMKSLLNYQATITKVVQNILDKLQDDISDKLQEAVDNLK